MFRSYQLLLKTGEYIRYRTRMAYAVKHTKTAKFHRKRFLNELISFSFITITAIKSEIKADTPFRSNKSRMTESISGLSCEKI